MRSITHLSFRRTVNFLNLLDLMDRWSCLFLSCNRTQLLQRERQTPSHIKVQQKRHRCCRHRGNLPLNLSAFRREHKSLPCFSTTYRRASGFHLSLAARELLTRFCHAICFPWELQCHILCIIKEKEQEKVLNVDTDLLTPSYELLPFVSRSPLMSNICRRNAK